MTDIITGDGEILELTPEMELDPVTPLDEFIDSVSAALRRYEVETARAAVGIVETNFDFYIDGYCLAGTDQVGEILCTAPDGRTATIKSSAFTDFLERRLD